MSRSIYKTLRRDERERGKEGKRERGGKERRPHSCRGASIRRDYEGVRENLTLKLMTRGFKTLDVYSSPG